MLRHGLITGKLGLLSIGPNPLIGYYFWGPKNPRPYSIARVACTDRCMSPREVSVDVHICVHGAQQWHYRFGAPGAYPIPTHETTPPPPSHGPVDSFRSLTKTTEHLAPRVRPTRASLASRGGQSHARTGPISCRAAIPPSRCTCPSPRHPVVPPIPPPRLR
jgi:hypothetical protein